MKTLEILIVIVWAIVFVQIGAGIVSASILFNRMEKKYPKYYKLIGQPKVLNYNGFFPTVSARNGRAFVVALMNKGVPDNFPNDPQSRSLARLIRYIGIGLVVGVIVFFGLVFTLTLKYGPNPK